MTQYQCAKGCRDPKAKDGRMWHYSSNECPAEDYNPNLHPGRPGKMRAKGHPGTPAKPAAPADAPVARIAVPVRPPSESITFRDERASVTKGSAKPIEPVVVDYIVDGPHTLALWNFGFRVLYFVHVKADEWIFDWHRHLPKEQFQVTKNGEMSITMDARNFYSRGATWFTKNLCQAKNLQQAHAAIDSIIFFEAFGGIFVAILFHYEHVYKESPKMKAKRAAAKAKKDALSGRIPAVDATFTSTSAPPPLMTYSTTQAVPA